MALPTCTIRVAGRTVPGQSYAVVVVHRSDGAGRVNYVGATIALGGGNFGTTTPRLPCGTRMAISVTVHDSHNTAVLVRSTAVWVTTPLVWTRPVDGVLTSRFGRRWGRMHWGIDIAAPRGAPVRAAAPGTVTGCAGEGISGRVIRMSHPGGITTMYAHLSAYVRCHGAVQAGDVIGRVGATGNATGPHLHFGVAVGGRYVDPLPFLLARGVRIET